MFHYKNIMLSFRAAVKVRVCMHDISWSLIVNEESMDFLCDREFKEKNKVDKVVVLWTANTERYSNVIVGLNDTMENLLASVDKDEHEISPSTLYGIACVMENVPYINGSPQNTFVPGMMLVTILNHLVVSSTFHEKHEVTE